MKRTIALCSLIAAVNVPVGMAEAGESHHDIYTSVSHQWWVEDGATSLRAGVVLFHYQWMRRVRSMPVLAGVRTGAGSIVSPAFLWGQLEFTFALRPPVDAERVSGLAELGFGVEVILPMLVAFPTASADIGLLQPVGKWTFLNLRIRGRATSAHGVGVWSVGGCVGVTVAERSHESVSGPAGGTR